MKNVKSVTNDEQNCVIITTDYTGCIHTSNLKNKGLCPENIVNRLWDVTLAWKHRLWVSWLPIAFKRITY